MERIHDDEFGTKFLQRFAFEIGGLAISFLLVVMDWGEWSLGFWLGVGGFFTTSLVAGHRIKHFTYKYDCPRCGHKAKRRPGNRVIFYCMTCDVEYVTRIRDEGMAKE